MADNGARRPDGSGSWAERLSADRAALTAGSRSQLLAAKLRQRITEGVFRPGERLSEEALSEALNVSRNTLREAFRQLAEEGVLVHEFGRGVFVRTLTVEDLRDIYALRRVLELAAVRNLPNAPGHALEEIREAVDSADEAAARQDWTAVGSANMRFHQAVVELLDNRRARDVVRRLLAELRLVFVVMDDLHDFHEPYRKTNRQLYELLLAGDVAGAEKAFTAYLDAAEAQLLAAYRH
ncbi:GntR family transcriptional regulator [Virgisporangium aliadipatigenens]|uniref:GntR family transcriptional regulator n=1 Tax=Virgisporangium aliadipatigenens TaxID=741659 RepID=A0A8J3YM13_9ACTN|nr:GntR family transcriptional regulator [Virgisporangium aliadipatigenens]GIJ46777.1 GntR family transcriptional regulator [Virgisporangium aliadipatigenens]